MRRVNRISDQRPSRSRRRRVVAAGAVALVLAALGASSGAAAQGAQPTGEAIEERDSLITAQESLLNVYRCRFDIDTIVVPGGCADGVPAEPAKERPRFAGTPTWREITQRDRLILSQEALLNVYRCLFSVDTSVVLGGCSDGRLASLPPAPDSCDFSERAGNAIESVWQVQAGQSLGTAFHLGQAENRHWWMTAEHVVRGSGTVVLMHSGRSIPARVVVADRSGDIAALSTEAGPSAELEFGGLAGSNPGAAIYAVGYPLYLASTPSVSRGVVSRLFDDPALGLILQTDASVNPGNSGGPMLDACGRVAGMVVSKAAAEGTEGINYSITEDALRQVLSDAHANPDQTPEPPPEPPPEIGEGSPQPGEWQEGQYDDGRRYLWFVAYVDERDQGAIIYEYPCGADYWYMAFWVERWASWNRTGRGFIRVWDDGEHDDAALYEANLVQHFEDGVARYLLHREFDSASSDGLPDPDWPTRLFIELLDSRQARGALLSIVRTEASEQELRDTWERTRSRVSC